MKILKLIIFLIALGLGAYLLFWLFGLLATVLWYGFWLAIVALGGYVGYKLFLAWLEYGDEDASTANAG